MCDRIYEETYEMFCQHLHETVTEEMFEVMVLCAVSKWWLVIGTAQDLPLHIKIYHLTNPSIGKFQKMILNYNNTDLPNESYSKVKYLIADKTNENLFYLANRLSAIKRWRVPACLLPLYDEIQQSYPDPSVYFDHTCENHFLDAAIQELKAECENWGQQRRAWYQRVVDDLLLLLKERYDYVVMKKDPSGDNEYETCYYLDSRKVKTLNVNLSERDSCIFVTSNDAGFNLELNSGIDALRGASKIAAFCECRYPSH